MLRRALFMLAGLLLTAAPGAPARALPSGEGCVAIGTHVTVSNAPVYGCHFRATGPVFFLAATPNPFVIYVDNGGGPEILVQRSESVPKNPGQAPAFGRLPTKANDHVFVSVSPWDYPNNRPCTNSATCGRDGFVLAQSQL
jgi:hypothetical protein